MGVSACGRCATEGTALFLWDLDTIPNPNYEICCGNRLLIADVPCTLQIGVQKVVITRKRQPAPMLSWLTGHQELMYVELTAHAAAVVTRKTDSGVLLKSESHIPGVAAQEVWVWGDEQLGGDGMQKRKGYPLWLKALSSTELSIKVLGRHQDWSNTVVPVEVLGEARFRIEEDVLPAMSGDGLLAMPLLQNCRIIGMVSLTAWAKPDTGPAPSMPRSSVPDDRLPIRDKTDQLVRLIGHILPVTCCAVFPCGTRVITGSADAVGIIWSTRGEQIAWLHGHSDAIASCAVFSSGEQVVTVAEDLTGIIWSSSGRQLATLAGVGLCVPFPRSDSLLARVGSADAAIFSNLGVQLASMKGHTDFVTSAAVFPAEDMVITGSRDADAFVWSVLGDTLKVLRGHSGAITACCVFPFGERVATASLDKTVIIWSCVGTGKEMGEQLAVLRGHIGHDIVGRISSCAIFQSAGETRLVTVSEDRMGIIWSDKGERLADMRGHMQGITGCAVFPKGDKILTVAADKLGALWATDTGVRLAELHGHSDVLRSCAVFPSGTHLLTTSDDMTAIIWPVAMFIDRPVRFRRV